VDQCKSYWLIDISTIMVLNAPLSKNEPADLTGLKSNFIHLRPMQATIELYEKYKAAMQKIADVKHAIAVLQWDQETYLPQKGASFRGQQISTLSQIAHNLFNDEELGKTLNELVSKKDLGTEEKRNVTLTLEDYEKNKKFTSEFVRKLAEQTNKTYHSWIDSRKQNSFSIFKNDLKALVDLKKQEADILGYKEHPYDALLNEYEKGATVKLIDKTFAEILPAIKPILDKIQESKQVDNSFLKQFFSKQQQWEWSIYLLNQLNYDSAAGRQDISEHPFSISFNSEDVRITTRIDENDFGNMTWSCIHEVGHALYEQGLPKHQYGLPLGEACSYSIHESQSRLWENHVGRSLQFWEHYYPALIKNFPEQFKNVSLIDFYKGINKVESSLIRTEADEITYHLHVYIRYELEKKLIEGSLKTNDIVEFWNDQYQQILNVRVPDDKHGCLQDVHWSHGSFGYFPTYSLGSFYAAQFYKTAKDEIENLDEQIKSGNLQPLLQWLRHNIHAKGRYHVSEELCKEITGSGLDARYFISHILEKYHTIYTLS
jgi:carboxypeptidase Taq